MPLPSFRHSRSKARRRRSHDALKPVSVSVCKKCGEPTLPHRVCKTCGFYGERSVKASKAKVEKTLDKKVKAPKAKKAAAEAKEETK